MTKPRYRVHRQQAQQANSSATRQHGTDRISYGGSFRAQKTHLPGWTGDPKNAEWIKLTQEVKKRLILENETLPISGRYSTPSSVTRSHASRWLDWTVVPQYPPPPSPSPSVRSFNSPDGSLLISSEAWMIRVWSVTTGSVIRAIANGSNGVSAIAVSADSKHIVSLSSWHGIQVWSVQTGHLMHNIDEKPCSEKTVAIRDVAHQVVIGTSEGSIELRDMKLGHCVKMERYMMVQSLACPYPRMDALSPAGKTSVWCCCLTPEAPSFLVNLQLQSRKCHSLPMIKFG
jgi:hypothetical protein